MSTMWVKYRTPDKLRLLLPFENRAQFEQWRQRDADPLGRVEGITVDDGHARCRRELARARSSHNILGTHEIRRLKGRLADVEAELSRAHLKIFQLNRQLEKTQNLRVSEDDAWRRRG